MRLDRLATLYVANPLRKFSPLPDQGCISMLMYHRISDAPEPNLSPYFKLNTSPPAFRDQMDLLHSDRYKVVDLLQGLKLLKSNSFTHKHVIITFDDGYQDFYTDAFPILQDYSFPATVFLPTAYIGDTHQKFRDSPCLSWSQIKEMRHHGIRFGSHTVDHPKLRDLKWSEIQTQLADSRKTIEDSLGEAMTTFAYPYAYPEMDRPFVTRFTAVLKNLGYECCVTTRIGTVARKDDPYSLKRLPMNDCDDSRLFRAKLSGSYNWLALPQRLRKLTKQGRPLNRIENSARSRATT